LLIARQILENDVNAVVMLTGLEEKGKVKCHKYWPEAGVPMTLPLDVEAPGDGGGLITITSKSSCCV
jgi:protein tyrosine phosphatase